MTDKAKAEQILYKLYRMSRREIFITSDDIIALCSSSEELDWWYRKLCVEKSK